MTHAPSTFGAPSERIVSLAIPHELNWEGAALYDAKRCGRDQVAASALRQELTAI
jgi:hypothetical protein